MKYVITTAAAAVAMAATAMPAAAQQADCDAAFKAADANNDGKVSNQEANTAVANEFNGIDSDNSGTISKSEWQNCGGPQMHTAMDAEDYGVEAGGDASMKKNQSGSQSASTAAQDEESAPPPWTTDEQFSQADTDKSGDVSREEAAKATASNYSKSGSQEAREQQARDSGARFAMIDSDGNGSISQQEWNKRDQADIASFFARLDEDNDNKLSKSEYQQVRLDEAAGEPVTVWYHYYVY